MQEPTVSIVTSTYNHAHFLDACVSSVLNQTYTNWEWILINDTSTDNTAEMLDRYAKLDSRIRVIHNEKNLRVPTNCNRGIEMARGSLIARIDTDDLWLPNKLETQVAFLNANPDHVLAGSWFRVIDERNEELYCRKPPVSDAELRSRMLVICPFNSSSVVFRREPALKVGGYRVNEFSEDYGLWLRLGTLGKIANVPEVLTNYRVVQAGITQTKTAQQSSEALQLIREFRGKYPNYLRALQKWYLHRFLAVSIGGKGLTWIRRSLFRMGLQYEA